MRGALHQADGFCGLLDSWVRRAAEAGASSFDGLLRRLPGAYPVDVAASVHRLWCAGSVPRSLVAHLLPRAEGPRQMVLPPPSLPLPHPLDHDWRFTAATSDFLLRQAVRFGRPHDAVIFLGTPSVFQTALRGVGSRRAVLVDANASVVRHLMRQGGSHRVLRCDVLADDVPPLRAPAIVADPPWYGDHMAAFVWAASRMSVAGGHVLMSLPPRGTRPGVTDDVARVLDLAAVLGFEVTLAHEGVLEYDSPPFERNALRAAGICLADPTWRRGDLYVLRCRMVTAHGRPGAGKRPDPWVSVSLFGLHARVRPNGSSQFTDPTLMPVVEGDVLASVSRRHPERASVDVWTAGNRVYRCAGTNVLRDIIGALAAGKDPVLGVASGLGRGLSKVETALVSASAEQVSALADRERADICFAGRG